MVELFSDSKDDLIFKLAQINISVPPRNKERKTEHLEKWCACRFICANLNSRWLTYPIEVQFQDRPDLLIRVPDRVIGIEITEAIHENAAKIDNYMIRNESQEPIFFIRYKAEDKKKKLKKLIPMAKGEVPNPGWEGDSVELEWASAMLGALQKKNENARKPGYGIYDENWLLIYDNWHLPALNLNLGMKYLCDKLKIVGLGFFGKVFIEHSNMLVCIEDSLSYTLLIPDICKSG